LTYLLAVLSSIAYGSADFLGGLATKRGAPLFAVVVLSQLTGLILILLALPFLPPSSPTAIDIAWGAAAGVAGGIGVALLYRALSIGVMSVVAPVTAVCAVIVPVIVGVALGERPALRAIAGVILAVVAIVLVSQSGEKRAATGVATAIASGIIIGFFLVFLARGGPSAGMWTLIAARVVSVSFFVLLGVLTRKQIAPQRESLAIVIGGGALDMLANILYVVAVRNGPLSIIATLTSLYPTSTIILARIVLRERLRAVQQSGVVCAGLAIVLIVTAG
jgi:uncharacterized membrane protein